MTETTLYAAYGRLAEVLPALFDVAQPLGQLAVLHDVRLCVQRFEQIPDNVAPGSLLPVSPRIIVGENFSLGDSFYTLVRQPGATVMSELFSLTAEQLHIVRHEYNLAPDWFQPVELSATTLDSHERVQVQTDAIGESQDFDEHRAIEGMAYPPPFLINHQRSVKAAQLVRASYLERQSSV